MKNFLRILVVNVSILFILCIIIELFLGGWLKSSNNLNNIGILKDVNLQYSLKKLYPDSLGFVNYTRDKYGLRGQNIQNSPNKVDILTIGGSTTDQRYIDDSKTWQTVLENNFKNSKQNFLVANAGVDGQSTFGHLKNFEIWFPEIKDLNPKYIIFYIGINDFYRISEKKGFDQIRIKESSGIAYYKELVKDNSAIFNLFRKLKGALKAKQIGVDHRKIDIQNYDFTNQGIAEEVFIKKFMDENLEGFRKRLHKLIEFTKNVGAIPIFVTQPSAKYKFNNGKLEGVDNVFHINKFKYNGVDYFDLLTKLNEVIYEVAEDDFIIIDLTFSQIFKEDDFYDWFHMTPKGTKKLGNEIFIQFKNRL